MLFTVAFFVIVTAHVVEDRRTKKSETSINSINKATITKKATVNNTSKSIQVNDNNNRIPVPSSSSSSSSKKSIQYYARVFISKERIFGPSSLEVLGI